MDSIKTTLLAFGLPGLFLIAFLDSGGVPLPGGVDLVVMLLSWQRPELFLLVAAIAALGSTLGCLLLYRIARLGGEAMMARFSQEQQDWVKTKVRENDILAMVVATLAPPPFPTKPFVLVAGIVRMDWRRFAGAVFAARVARFAGEGYLAVRLGDRAAETLREHYPTIALVLAVAVVAYVVGRRMLRRRVTA